MRILLLVFLYMAASSVQGYGDPWVEHTFSQITPTSPRPIHVLTNVINELGVRILQQYGETGNLGNVAFSPTGIGFVLAALYEGSAGHGNEQIAHVLGLPRDRDITRIGLRDIHRRLRSYLSPDGFLGGLTLNRENTKLRQEYEEILKFIGFDFPSGNEGSNATDSSTSSPEFNSSSASTETPAESFTINSTEESTSTVTPMTTDGITSATQVAEEVSGTSTDLSIEATTLNSKSEEVTTLKNDGQLIPESTKSTEVVEVTEEISIVEETTVFKTTPEVTTTPFPAIVTEVSSKMTEVSSAIPPDEGSTEPLPLAQLTTVDSSLVSTTTQVENEPETTLASMEEAMTTVRTETTTLEPEESVGSGETMTSTVFESSTTTEAGSTVVPSKEDSIDRIANESEAETTSFSSVENEEDLTTTTTESSSTLTTEETVSNEIDKVDMIKNKSENLLSLETKNVNVEMSTTSSSIGMNISERRRVRKIGIRDPVVRTLLEATSANSIRDEVAKLNSNNSRVSKVVWIKKIKQEKSDDKTENFERDGKTRVTRSPRGYFPNFSTYPEFPGYPEDNSWTRRHGGWRVHSPKNDESSQDSTEMTFLVNGEDATIVSAATYTVVLPFAFLPNLQALALEFPLDDPRYNILLLLPTDRDGSRRLARDLSNVALTEIRKELQPAWVRAIIPSFMLKGFVTLTPYLQRLGIRDVFEPRAADLTPMTEDVGVYARDVQQSIGVNIRNYMKPDRTHSRNGILERAGPVSFIAEHPFLFFIIDAETGVSLIAGRIEDPLNSRIL